MITRPILARILCALVSSLIVIALPATASDMLKREPDFVYIASFNVRMLGNVEKRYRSVVKDTDLQELDGTIPRRISNLANILAFGRFDLVAIQEVKHGPTGHAAVMDLVNALKDRHSLVYNYFLSGEIGPGLRKMPESIAFLYNPETVLPEPIDGTERLWSLVEIPGRDLVRTQWEASHFDFTMYAVHLAYGNLQDRRKGYEKIASIFEQPLDWSDDPDVIVLGDFNRLGEISQKCAKEEPNCTELTPIKALEYNTRSPNFRAPNITAFDPAFSRCPQVQNCCNKYGAPMLSVDSQLLSTTVSDNTYAYDAIMFSRDANEEFPADLHAAKYGTDFGIIHFDHPDGVGFQCGAEMLDRYEIEKAYSDHRPVWIRFRIDDPSHADD